MQLGQMAPIEQRERSRSPPRDRVPLERLAGAQRDTMPAWMKRGVGVNEEIFGKTTGDLVKPGMTKADVEQLEARVFDDADDPMAEIFNERRQADPDSAPIPSIAARAPLPDQSSFFGGGSGIDLSSPFGKGKGWGKGKFK